MAGKKNLTDVFKERKGKVETDAETGTVDAIGAAPITTGKASVGIVAVS